MASIFVMLTVGREHLRIAVPFINGLFQAEVFRPIDHDAVFGIMADTLIAVYPLHVQSIHLG